MHQLCPQALFLPASHIIKLGVPHYLLQLSILSSTQPSPISETKLSHGFGDSIHNLNMRASISLFIFLLFLAFTSLASAASLPVAANSSARGRDTCECLDVGSWCGDQAGMKLSGNCASIILYQCEQPSGPAWAESACYQEPSLVPRKCCLGKLCL